MGNIDWNTITAVSTIAASAVIVVTAIIALGQLREMKRATIAQAFSTVINYLQSPEAREARKVPIHIEQSDFSKWTSEQIEKAETACNTYDVIGILLRRRVIDPKMVTAEWRNSIIKYWQHAQPIFKAYHEDRGMDFWNDFEWLYHIAQNRKG